MSILTRAQMLLAVPLGKCQGMMSTLSLLSFKVIGEWSNSWSSPDGGNTKADLDLADRKVNYGSTPPWDALDKIKDH
ncbi:hypothetical protein H634G_04200 [Metarhizium anisopliae BRIP 53293]|uniref:Uncharacterized protein n=1 Tax=Metarhizium anisopliae BRIP 53293 TaxID=1291518 RepID=A0A0D9P1H1_METAN|nr:hypothetical protein H634G_04200 [Metarhizium anisopliae BRIP 53293]KJK95964.1 hypothetical protein H633G_00313 [Metarhizium anisopliae BRIP 53284]